MIRPRFNDAALAGEESKDAGSSVALAHIAAPLAHCEIKLRRVTSGCIVCLRVRTLPLKRRIFSFQDLSKHLLTIVPSGRFVREK